MHIHDNKQNQEGYEDSKINDFQEKTNHMKNTKKNHQRKGKGKSSDYNDIS